MTDERLRLGFLYPGRAAEDDYPYLADRLEPPVTAELFHTTQGEDAHRVDALLDLGGRERLGEGADALRSRDVAVVMWACTSGSFVFGWEGAHEQVAHLQQRTGLPASSTSLAFVAACRALDIGRVAVAATYPGDVTERLVAFLSRADIEVVVSSSSGIITAAEVGTLEEEAVRELVLSHDHPDSEAVIVPDTALRSAYWLPGLEEAAGKPVLTANQVTVWQAACLAGHPGVGRDLGRLLGGLA